MRRDEPGEIYTGASCGDNAAHRRQLNSLQQLSVSLALPHHPDWKTPVVLLTVSDIDAFPSHAHMLFSKICRFVKG